MKIALLGYGKMGHEIEKLAMERGHNVDLILDKPEDWIEKRLQLSQVDVAIDFSTPDTAFSNIFHCFDAGIPIVEGTTGWHDRIDEVRKECLLRQQCIFWAPNFSIGVNIFFELNRQLAKLMSVWHEYDISLEETHHKNKLDTPSGTAIVLANDIIDNHGRKKKWVKEVKEHPDDLGIRSYRVEEVTGSHKVIYESQEDIIEIIHTAKNRRGFAMGALMAAEWVQGKKGFFEMKDLLEDVKNK